MIIASIALGITRVTTRHLRGHLAFARWRQEIGQMVVLTLLALVLMYPRPRKIARSRRKAARRGFSDVSRNALPNIEITISIAIFPLSSATRHFVTEFSHPKALARQRRRFTFHRSKSLFKLIRSLERKERNKCFKCREMKVKVRDMRLLVQSYSFDK